MQLVTALFYTKKKKVQGNKHYDSPSERKTTEAERIIDDLVTSHSRSLLVRSRTPISTDVR